MSSVLRTGAISGQEEVRESRGSYGWGEAGKDHRDRPILTLSGHITVLGLTLKSTGHFAGFWMPAMQSHGYFIHITTATVWPSIWGEKG